MENRYRPVQHGDATDFLKLSSQVPLTEGCTIWHPQTMTGAWAGEVSPVAWRKQPSRLLSASALALPVIQSHHPVFTSMQGFPSIPVPGVQD